MIDKVVASKGRQDMSNQGKSNFKYFIYIIIEECRNTGSSSNLELKEFFKSAGITKQDLQDKEKREFICQFLKANIDKLFSESGI